MDDAGGARPWCGVVWATPPGGMGHWSLDAEDFELASPAGRERQLASDRFTAASSVFSLAGMSLPGKNASVKSVADQF